jgi:hypothetical protein
MFGTENDNKTLGHHRAGTMNIRHISRLWRRAFVLTIPTSILYAVAKALTFEGGDRAANAHHPSC